MVSTLRSRLAASTFKLTHARIAVDLDQSPYGCHSPRTTDELGDAVIIWGSKSYVQTLAMLTLVCRNGHTAAHRLAKRTRKFTLFFIPLFPIGVRRFTVCTACGETLTIDKEQAEAMLARAQGAAPVGPDADGSAPLPPMPPAVDPASAELPPAASA